MARVRRYRDLVLYALVMALCGGGADPSRFNSSCSIRHSFVDDLRLNSERLFAFAVSSGVKLVRSRHRAYTAGTPIPKCG